MKQAGEFARPQPEQQPETNKVSSVSTNNLPFGFYAIFLTGLSVVNNAAVAPNKNNKGKSLGLTCISFLFPISFV